jgi:hypothetical protein
LVSRNYEMRHEITLESMKGGGGGGGCHHHCSSSSKHYKTDG